ncbi:MAG: tyrosine-type recombinase/integrase, partial [Bacteroidales bacterium]|nr:tyrosine-type recombinase/integrase [Bacteroidales bacterium]
TNKGVAAATQSQALNGILFLYHQVLDIKIEGKISALRSRKAKRLPVVLSQDEIHIFFEHLSGTTGLMINLMYGSGLRISEVLRLRVQDFDFSSKQIYVRNSKGGKDRITLLPNRLHSLLEEHLKSVRVLFDSDTKKGSAAVYIPAGVEKKYPNACKDLHGRLRTGAAVGITSETEERVRAVVNAGVDAVFVDTAHAAWWWLWPA